MVVIAHKLPAIMNADQICVRRIFVFEKKLVKKLIFDEGEIETLIQENYKCMACKWEAALVPTSTASPRPELCSAIYIRSFRWGAGGSFWTMDSL